ncbi:MAG: RlmE family RNA methyltransferase [Gammaproteobacteria bacterium]|nr:RlmE family RNA methyltransferase [Gammaproteobacteria bacterium]
MKRGKGKSASSRRWVARRERDPYVDKARRSNLRSRAVFKLEQIDARDKLFRAGQRVVDLGAAPGGFSQYLARKVGPRGLVVAVDRLDMTPIDGVVFVHGDFLDPDVAARLDEILAGPSTRWFPTWRRTCPESGTGTRRAAANWSTRRLHSPGDGFAAGGVMVVKIFEGGERAAIVAAFRECFAGVTLRKPDASRARSPECYIVAKGYNRPDEDPSSVT